MFQTTNQNRTGLQSLLCVLLMIVTYHFFFGFFFAKVNHVKLEICIDSSNTSNSYLSKNISHVYHTQLQIKLIDRDHFSQSLG